MKRLSLALMSIGISATIFAAYPAASDPTLITIPQLPGGFFVGGSGYFLQPTDSNGDLDYVDINTNAASAIGGLGSPFASEVSNVNPGFSWGWGIEAGYEFANTANDIEIKYFNLNTNDTASMASFPVSMLPLIYSQDDAAVNAFNVAFADASYDLNQVDLIAGQYIDIGCRLHIHPNAGLRWAEIDRNLTTTYAQSLVPFSLPFPPNITNVSEKSDFSGIGPLAGIDASYYLGLGVGLVAHADTGALIGNMDTKTNAALSALVIDFGPVVVNESYNFKAETTNRVVPFTDAKLGFDYTYLLHNAANSDITFEAGYQASNYFNAVDRLETHATVTDSANTLGRKTSDLGLNGPYASLVFHI